LVGGELLPQVNDQYGTPSYASTFLPYLFVGCAKTTLIQAAITASGASSQVLTPAQLYSSLVGEGEAILRAAFSTARSTAPSIIFFDELDTIAGSRSEQSGDQNGSSQLLTSLLTEIDGLENAEGEQ
jgi:SpoVK/Ycf46/Vps4 family AAA+-type ATPase